MDKEKVAKELLGLAKELTGANDVIDGRALKMMKTRLRKIVKSIDGRLERYEISPEGRPWDHGFDKSKWKVLEKGLKDVERWMDLNGIV
jgi:hypothetical protein